MKKYVFPLIIIFLLLSCSIFDEDEDIQLLSKKMVYIASHGGVLSQAEALHTETYIYEYDKNTLIKLSHFVDLEGGEFLINWWDYTNQGGNVLSKVNHHSNINSPSGYVILDSTSSFYEGNKLKREVTYHPFTGSSNQIEYDYSGDEVVKQTYTRDEQLEYEIHYERTIDTIEERHLDTTGNCYLRVIHHLDNGIKTKTEFFNSTGLITRRINYFYNRDGDLTSEESRELVQSSSGADQLTIYKY